MDNETRANIILFVPTTIHVPENVLRLLDIRAKALGVSRNRVILSALESSLGSRRQWPPELVEMLAHPLEAASAKLLDQTMHVVRRRRRSRPRAISL